MLFLCMYVCMRIQHDSLLALCFILALHIPILQFLAWTSQNTSGQVLCHASFDSNHIATFASLVSVVTIILQMMFMCHILIHPELKTSYIA